MKDTQFFSATSPYLSSDKSTPKSLSAGRLHKQRQSYGPTVHIFNSKSINSEPETEFSDSITKIFLLMLEVERLTAENSHYLKEQKNRNSYIHQTYEYESISIKEENIRLKSTIETYEKDRETETNNRKAVFQLRTQVSELEMTIRNLKRKNQELVDSLEKVRRQKKFSEELADRAKMETSKMGLSMMFNSSGNEMRKSFVKEKAVQIDVLKEKANRFEALIYQQKIFISSQQNELNIAKNRQIELTSKLDHYISMHKQTLKFSTGTIAESSNMRVENNSEIEQLRREIGQLRRDIDLKNEELLYKSRQINDLNKTMKILEQQLKNITNQVSNEQSLSKSALKEVQIRLISMARIKDKLEKTSHKDKEQYEIELTIMRTNINQLKIRIQDRENELNQKNVQLSEVINNHKNQRKKDRDYLQEPIKINKSLSMSSLMSKQKFRHSELELDKAVSGLIRIRDSNEKMGQLINSRSVKHVRVSSLYYAN